MEMLPWKELIQKLIDQQFTVYSVLTHNVDQVYFNRDRLNPVYEESHLIRLREAYQKYVVAAK